MMYQRRIQIAVVFIQFSYECLLVMSLGKLYWTLHRKRMPLFSSDGRKSSFIVNVDDWPLVSASSWHRWYSLSFSCLHYSELLQRTQLSLCLRFYFFQAAPYSWEHCSGSSQWCSLWTACHFSALLSLLPVVECRIKYRLLLLTFEVMAVVRGCM